MKLGLKSKLAGPSSFTTFTPQDDKCTYLALVKNGKYKIPCFEFGYWRI
jgi:hypothetical protein